MAINHFSCKTCDKPFENYGNKHQCRAKKGSVQLLALHAVPVQLQRDSRNYSDRSDGFYRRLYIIRFKRPEPKEQRDPNLLHKLATERDGILMWAIQGLQRLMAQNYQFTETE